MELSPQQESLIYENPLLFKRVSDLFLNNFEGYKLLSPHQYCLWKFWDMNIVFWLFILWKCTTCLIALFMGRKLGIYMWVWIRDLVLKRSSDYLQPNENYNFYSDKNCFSNKVIYTKSGVRGSQWGWEDTNQLCIIQSLWWLFSKESKT